MAGLADLVAEVEAAVGAVLDAMGWADDEVDAATARHPDAWDVLYHAHRLLVPGDGMGVDWVYRAHARELLERAAAGADTRPGTAVEVVLLCARTSGIAPFHTAAVGLYLRMWAAAFPDRADLADPVDREHYEALRADQIDDLEREARRKLAVPDRRLTAVDCPGRHFGEPVACRYGPARPAVVPTPRRAVQPALLDLAVGPT